MTEARSVIIDKHSIKTSFIDYAPTKDDPRGERGFATWQMTRRGKQYGGMITLTKDPNRTFDEQCDDAIFQMLIEMLDLCAELDSKHAKGD